MSMQIGLPDKVMVGQGVSREWNSRRTTFPVSSTKSRRPDSHFRCGHSADPIQIFGSGGGEKLSRETGLPLLGAIPFDLELGRSGDSGVPLILSAPDPEAGLVFQQVARELSRQVEDVRQKES